MPDKREHRGPHPSDADLFGPDKVPLLREGLADFSLLLSKGYADRSALKLVGDRFGLTQRQRVAVMRSACSDAQRQSRLSRRVEIGSLPGQPLAIDGYNLLITIEAAMSGGLIFRGRDGCFRDLASIHGTYRKVDETLPALKLIGTFLADLGIAEALWLLDSPVSNSGRLKTLVTDLAQAHHWPWIIRLSLNPDAELRGQLAVDSSQFPAHGQPPTDNCQLTTENRQLPPIVVTTDSVVLDACGQWTNLAAEIITRRLPAATIIDLVHS